MVAYTPELCLPYFEPTDSPCVNLGTVCDPVNIWCDLITKVEAQLDAVDTVMDRVVSAIPLASVSITYDSATIINGVIPFDTVEIDTDNMVDLPVFTGITPVRNGIYGITARVLFAPIVTNDFPDVRIYIGNETAPQQGGTLALGPVQTTTRGFNTAQWVFAATHWDFNDTSPSPRSISVFNTYVTGGVLEAHLDVFWHSES